MENKQPKQPEIRKSTDRQISVDFQQPGIATQGDNSITYSFIHDVLDEINAMSEFVEMLSLEELCKIASKYGEGLTASDCLRKCLLERLDNLSKKAIEGRINDGRISNFMGS